MKRLLFMISIFLVSGCATSPVNPKSAKSVPAHRLLYAGSGSSKITITRDTGWFAGGGCFVMVTLDGINVLRIDTNESATLSVPYGRYILGITADKLGGGLCKYENVWPVKERSIELNYGEVQYFRISGDMFSGLDIRPTTII